MVNFQQIIQWINSIANLKRQVQPVAERIRSEAKTKTLNGIQFVDFEGPSLSNIQELNRILEENGLDQIDESLFSSSLLNVEQILQQMQNDFTEDELAQAIAQPAVVDELRDFTALDFDLADVCDPPTIIETPEFSEDEILNAACEIPVTDVEDGTVTNPVESLPLQDVEITPDLDQQPAAEQDPNENIFQQLSELGGNANPANGPACLSKMQEVSTKVQEKVREYTQSKEEIQKIQLDYFYQVIVDAYYQSFIEGYGEIESLRKELSGIDPGSASGQERISEIQKRLVDLPDYFTDVKDRSSMQDKMEEVILSFSNQFDIDINSGFLGLFQTYPKISINKEKTPLSGKVKDIPDDLLSFVDSTPKDDPDSIKLITEKANKSEQDLQTAFEKTVESVKFFSFGFGLNWYLEKEDVDNDFSKEAADQNAKKIQIEKQYLELKKKEEESQAAIDEINTQIMEELKKLNCESKETPTEVEAGKDLNFKNVSKNPTIFDYDWWVKFSKLATVVNLVPVHWPVGLLIPTPSGLIKVPFPIIWIPLFVAPTDKLIAVIFIGQCGILPCPFIFLQHFLPIPLGPFISNNPYFALAIRGPINISSHEPLPPVVLPSFNPLFTILLAVIESLRSGVVTDFNLLVQQVRDEIERINRDASQYLARIDVEAFDVISIARNQATAAIKNAKSSAELAIEQAKQEGQRLIDEARSRYQDALELENVTLAITQGVQAKVTEAQLLVEQARAYADSIIADATTRASNLKKTAEDTVKGIIEQGKRTYELRLSEIQGLEEQYEKTLETLRDLISKIQIPTFNLGTINLSALLAGFTLSLGSLQSLAATLSPKAIQFGFPTELDPKFSAILPIVQDELPPWERLSLLNIPLLFFLWKWCKAGKEKGGFFRDAF